MKTLPFLLAPLLIPSLLSAGPVGYGLEGGLNMADQTSGYLSANEGDVLFGPQGGFFLEMDLGGPFSFRPGLDLSIKGVQESLKNIPVVDMGGNIVGTADWSANFTFDYLDLPLLLKAGTPRGPGLEGHLFAGPVLGILVSANEHYSALGITGNAGLNGAPLVLEGEVGGGIEFSGILLDLRYEMGFTSVYNSPGADVRDSNLSLTAGYRIL